MRAIARTGLRILTAVLIVIAAVALTVLWFTRGWRDSKALDPHPTVFTAEADKPFFYSVHDELKSSNQIRESARTLLKGRIGNFLVSPDDTMIAAVANDALYVVSRDGRVRRVAAVDSIYREHVPVGKAFFRDADFRWTRDSRSLYLIHDQFYETERSQLYSKRGELWRYDIPTGKLALVLRPFEAYNYFFGRDGIYFSVPTSTGDLQLRYFDGQHATDAGSANELFTVTTLRSGGPEEVFFSYDEYDNPVVAPPPPHPLTFHTDQAEKVGTLEVDGRPILHVSEGVGLKGPYYCLDALRQRWLPGDRYALIEVHCDNLEGALLVDSITGDYEQLPGDARVYRTFSTRDHANVQVSGAGIRPI